MAELKEERTLACLSQGSQGSGHTEEAGVMMAVAIRAYIAPGDRCGPEGMSKSAHNFDSPQT